jgi:hypothetical protein
LLYFGAAHASLLLACALVGLWPRAVAGFFYHSWMVAIVHLVTLGWITLSILGSTYIVGPSTLGVWLPARRGDYVAFASAMTGVVGMVAHFWIDSYAGMVWSAGMVVGGAFFVGVRIVSGLSGAPVTTAVKLHIALAWANLALAATAGMLLGLDKVYHFLPGFVLSNVFAHAHLAAIGWAVMMVVGVGYRLLPMVILAKAPSGRSLFVSAALLELGVLALFSGLVLRAWWVPIGGLLILSGIGSFAAHVAVMLRDRRRGPAEAPPVDYAVLHAAAAGVSLVVACGFGMFLLVAHPSDAALRVALAYGVLGLVGFLGQMVTAMEAKLLPMLAWYHALANGGFREAPAPPYAMADRRLQHGVFLGWVFAVPAVASGLALNAIPLLTAGAWTLFAAVVLGSLNNALVMTHAWNWGRESFSSAVDRHKSRSTRA